MDGRHPTVPVRDAVCFSLSLIELLIYSVELPQMPQSCMLYISLLKHD